MDKRVIRGIYLYEFKLGTTAKEAGEKINAAFGQGCSTIRTAYRWYQKFRNGDESMEEHEGRGRHSDVDEDKLRNVVEEDPHKGFDCNVFKSGWLSPVYQTTQRALHVARGGDLPSRPFHLIRTTSRFRMDMLPLAGLVKRDDSLQLLKDCNENGQK
ncbi:unnamed protein product [Heligmosomoides polygyrus]|uniref:HTH_48 domain-containing protein n=1 Tax=Heligmosomoides polygyrus TaxID=6339 RepID=A0A183G927_HELPZ|nr:unnamed protein product [Heligmosomoides polygyrus]